MRGALSSRTQGNRQPHRNRVPYAWKKAKLSRCKGVKYAVDRNSYDSIFLSKYTEKFLANETSSTNTPTEPFPSTFVRRIPQIRRTNQRNNLSATIFGHRNFLHFSFNKN